ncbi:hypothetical protein Q2T76_02780, partial [Lactobacillus sp. YT155]|uniref:hypothetical protein n=1 Tax=Lactobacillus sp. YT155 TaxID=3060955 RepID=UPI002660537E
MKLRKRIAQFIMTLGVFVLGLGSVSGVSRAVTQTETPNYPIAKTATDNGDGTYGINFKLPEDGTVQKVKIDIVFAVDTTTIKNYANVKAQLEAFTTELNSNPNIEAKIGIVTIQRDATDKLNGLVPLNDDSLATINKGFAASYTAGSNLHGGLLKSQKLLDSDTEVEADHKYLIVASDMAGWLVDNGSGTGSSIAYRDGQYIGNAVSTGNQDFFGRYYKNPLENITVADIDNLVNNMTMFNGQTPAGDYVKYMQQYGTSIGEYPYNWLKYGSLFHPTWTDEEKATMPPSFAFVNSPQFPPYFEKSMYLSGRLFKDMKAAGYNISELTTPYQAGDPTYANLHNTNQRFQEWLEQNIGKRFDSTRNESMTEILADLKAKIYYQVGKGQIT